VETGHSPNPVIGPSGVPVEYRILGPLEVVRDGHPVALGSGKQRTLLAVLLLHAGEIVPTDRLIDLVWGEDPPRTAAHSVQIYVSELRRALGSAGRSAAIETRPPGYLLHIEAEALDARRFERLVTEARERAERGDHAGAVRPLRAALELWRGSPLADFTYDEFAQAEILHLTALHLDALEALAAAELELGRAQEALAHVRIGIARDPLRERFRELEMLCLYRLGRHAEALRTFQTFQATLAEDLGLDPSPSLRQVQERILLHDATLTAARAETTTAEVRNPYKGLRAFDERDARDFFGRDGLVRELLAALASPTRLVSVVGPSGCGKSSAVNAGVLPALREGAIPGSERWEIARVPFGARPLAQLEEALAQARSGTQLLLVIDPFEQVFSSGTEAESASVLERLSTVLTEPGFDVRAVASLRADFYDRPLQHPAFSGLFTANIVNVLPMTTEELEAAVVEPASRNGVTVQPALLGEILADTTDRPGGLPLLQFSLSELFDHRSGSELTLDGYRSLGGLRGLVSRRSEMLYDGLDEEGRRTCLQVFLRLVRIDVGAKDARRRTPLRELTEIGLDPVAVSDILEAFGRHRLLTFDREPSTGEATVEVAHEALLWEWERLAAWIGQHRDDIRRLDSLARATDEWEASGRDPDYLIGGSQLAGYEEWSRDAGIAPGTREQRFLAAALERREDGEQEMAIHRASRRRLERRSRSRLGDLISSISEGRIAGPEVVRRPPDVALVWEGYGDGGWNDAIGTGFDRATDELGLHAVLRVVALEAKDPLLPELRRLSEIGVGLIVVGSANVDLPGLEAVAREHPDRRYVANDATGDVPNITYLVHHEEQGSFLAGAAAAIRSGTGRLGFVGGSPVPLIHRFEAGFAAGARTVRPDVDVRIEYLRPEGYWGYADPRSASEVAGALYREGADVVYTAAGSSGFGVFHAAERWSGQLDRPLWVIGVDVDQYEMLAGLEELPEETREAWRAHCLTSMVKRYDVVLSAVLGDHVAGTLRGGTRHFSLADRATDITYSGGFIDDLRPVIEDLKARIVAGDIMVPSRPGGR
jgi:basic membrane lipoprotein Med (substrate-binding protein (PBP1-ABC) superfamily)/DNA-binding SARP family transcriptional activator